VNHIIWKYNFGVYTSRKFVSSHITFCITQTGSRYVQLGVPFARDERRGGVRRLSDREDVWTINRDTSPAQEEQEELPIALLEKMLLYSSNEAISCAIFSWAAALRRSVRRIEPPSPI